MRVRWHNVHGCARRVIPSTCPELPVGDNGDGALCRPPGAGCARTRVWVGVAATMASTARTAMGGGCENKVVLTTFRYWYMGHRSRVDGSPNSNPYPRPMWVTHTTVHFAAYTCNNSTSCCKFAYQTITGSHTGTAQLSLNLLITLH